MNHIKKVLNILLENDFDAYIVGGFVRDYIMGNKSIDIDICTNAKVDMLIKLFPNYSEKNEYGIKFKYRNYYFEITTYRKETYNNDRHPQVEFISSLSEDLERRDFTINSICMDRSYNIIDKYNGKDDIKEKIIRCIGDENKKLSEDPLRMLRAIRFATVLNFKLDEKLKKSIKKNSKLISSLSNERIKEEFDKILLSKNVNYGISLLKETGIDKVIGLSSDELEVSSYLNLMYAQLSINVKHSNKDSKEISDLREIILSKEINYFTLFNFGLDANIIAAQFFNIPKKEIVSLFKSMPIKKLSDIKISGKEIMELLNIEPSKEVSNIIYDLKKEILCGTIKNNKKDLKGYILRKWSK